LAALHCLGFTIFILTQVQTHFKKKMQKETPKLDFPTLAGNAIKTQSHEAALQSRFHSASPESSRLLASYFTPSGSLTAEIAETAETLAVCKSLWFMALRIILASSLVFRPSSFVFLASRPSSLGSRPSFFVSRLSFIVPQTERWASLGRRPSVLLRSPDILMSRVLIP